MKVIIILFGNLYKYFYFSNKRLVWNTSLKKELSKIIKDIEEKSIKGQKFNQSDKSENILEDDLTIIGLGK